MAYRLPERLLSSSELRDQLQATLSGSYSLERELGRGMSRVVVAEESRLKRKVESRCRYALDARRIS